MSRPQNLLRRGVRRGSTSAAVSGDLPNKISHALLNAVRACCGLGRESLPLLLPASKPAGPVERRNGHWPHCCSPAPPLGGGLGALPVVSDRPFSGAAGWPGRRRWKARVPRRPSFRVRRAAPAEPRVHADLSRSPRASVCVPRPILEGRPAGPGAWCFEKSDAAGRRAGRLHGCRNPEIQSTASRPKRGETRNPQA